MARTTKPPLKTKPAMTSVPEASVGSTDDAVTARRADPSGARDVTPGAARPAEASTKNEVKETAPIASPPVAAPPVVTPPVTEELSPSSVPLTGQAPRSGKTDRSTEKPSQKSPAQTPPASNEKPSTSGPGFLPLVLGGLVAGGIGFAVATFAVPSTEQGADDTTVLVDPARVDALAADVEALQAAETPQQDLSPLETAQADLIDQFGVLTARVDRFETNLSAVSSTATENSDALPEAPIATSDVTQTLRTDLDSLSDDLGTLRDDLTPRIAFLEDDLVPRVSTLEELPSRVSAVEEGLSEAQTIARDVEAEAEELARDTARNQIRVALQAGTPFSDPLTVLGDAPAALADVAKTGVPPLRVLIDDFPELSRAALREARAAAPSAGVGSLFRNALNPRSLEPREGDDPDAVLSRVEAAVRDGDLNQALTEIGTLPAEAQAVLDPWTTRAQARAEALAAADDYLQDG